MKKNYEKPIIDIENFSKEDVITTSNVSYTPEGQGGIVDWEDLF